MSLVYPLTVCAFKEFNVGSRRDADRTTAWFDGELDCGGEGLARAEIEIALDRGGSELVLDLRNVSFLDARGVRVLLGARSACEARNLRLTLQPSDRVQDVLELCCLGDAFELAEPQALSA